MRQFEQIRHRPASPLPEPRELVLACAPLRSRVNLSRIVRVAGSMGVTRVHVTDSLRLDRKVAREAADQVTITRHGSLAPLLKRLRSDGYRLAGLEQSVGSESLFEHRFASKTALVIGNERRGL